MTVLWAGENWHVAIVYRVTVMKHVLLVTLFTVFSAAILFGSAGRVDLPLFWAWIAVPTAAAAFVGCRMDADFMKERLRPGAGGTDRWLRFIATPFWLAQMVVAGLDVGRFHWSDTVPLTLRVAGLVVFAATYALVGWSVWVNRFYSPVVRIQSERGHVLVTGGPYGWVRHPGYAGLLLAIPFGGLVLGSWWALAVVTPLLLLILRRTIVEDGFLHENLDGYRDYARRVRHRLVPGVW